MSVGTMGNHRKPSMLAGSLLWLPWMVELAKMPEDSLDKREGKTPSEIQLCIEASPLSGNLRAP